MDNAAGGAQETGVTVAAPRPSHLSHPYRLCHQVSPTRYI